jgi:hypothetical protein
MVVIHHLVVRLFSYIATKVNLYDLRKKLGSFIKSGPQIEKAMLPLPEKAAGYSNKRDGTGLLE